MKLSELNPNDIEAPPSLKLSDIHPDDVSLSQQKEAPGMLESALRGGLQGATLGYGDEAASGVASALQTAQDAIQNKIPENESTIQHLVNQYKRYKGMSEADEAAAKKANPITYGGAQIAGSFLPVGAAFKGVAGAGLGTKIATGAGLGAVNEYGNLGQDEQDKEKKVAEGAALGGIGTGIGETVVSPLMKYIGQKGINVLQNQPVAKQIAATIQNKLNGGTLFGEAGQDAVAAKSKALTGDIADTLTGNVEENLGNMKEAFKQSMAERLVPEANHLQTIGDFETAINARNPGSFKDQFAALKAGAMNPEDANNFRTQLKNYVSGLFTSNATTGDPVAHQLATNIRNELIPTIENMSEQTSTPIGDLNKDISGARSLLDPFTQKANAIVDDNQQSGFSSNKPLESQNLRVQDTLNRIVDRSGRSVKLGSGARNSLADFQNLLEKAKQVSPTLGANNPNFAADTARDLQTQGYLNAAATNVQGIQQSKFNPIMSPGTFASKIVNPFHVAEIAAKTPIIGSALEDLSKRLLSPTPLDRQMVGQALYSNPATKAIADQYEQAIVSKNPGRLNNVIFQMMQNPQVKQLLGSNKEGNQ